MFLPQQTKRKLDDAAKRLGFLYDKLREQSVRSDSIILRQGYRQAAETLDRLQRAVFSLVLKFKVL